MQTRPPEISQSPILVSTVMVVGATSCVLTSVEITSTSECSITASVGVATLTASMDPQLAATAHRIKTKLMFTLDRGRIVFIEIGLRMGARVLVVLRAAAVGRTPPLVLVCHLYQYGFTVASILGSKRS